METSIPFAGFYESIHNDRIERAWNVSEDDFYMAKQKDAEETEEQVEKRYDSIDWKKEFKDYAQYFTEQLSDALKISLKYNDMTSPREYNFTTDRIFAEISEKDVLRMYNSIDRELLGKRVEDRFMSYDGFCSFYSNDFESWKDVLTWDHNQLETLLQLCIEKEIGDDWEMFLTDDYCV